MFRINAWKTPSKLPDLVTFMIDLFAIEPGIVLRSKNEPIFDTLCDALKLFLAQDIPLSLKIDAFDLLPVYICAEESSMDSVRHQCRNELVLPLLIGTFR